MTAWLSIIAGVVGIIGVAAKIFMSRREREVGRLEGANEAYQDEINKTRSRAKVDEDTRRLGPGDLEQRLRGGRRPGE